jgi:hypothetical protein
MSLPTSCARLGNGLRQPFNEHLRITIFNQRLTPPCHMYVGRKYFRGVSECGRTNWPSAIASATGSERPIAMLAQSTAAERHSPL